MGWLILTIASAITGALARILQKVLLKDSQSNTFAFSFVFQLTVSGLFLLYALTTQTFELPNLSKVLPNLGVMMVGYSLGNLFLFKAFKHAQASEVSIIFASSTVWSVLAALVLLHETLTIRNWFGIFLIVSGVAAINYSKTKWQINKGHLFALGGAILFGIAFTNDAYILTHYQSIPSYMVIAFALPGVFTLAYQPQAIKQIPYFLKLSRYKKLVLCTILYALSALTIFSAFKLGGPASIISPIQQTSIIFTVVFGYIFLKEKDKMANKIVGTALAFLGVLLLI